jgi:hypothetical protein
MIGSAFRRASVTRGGAGTCPKQSVARTKRSSVWPTASRQQSAPKVKLVQVSACSGAGGGGQPQDTFCQAFYPLTMPLTVGPRSISVAITLGANASLHHSDHPLTILAALIGFRGLHRKQPASVPGLFGIYLHPSNRVGRKRSSCAIETKFLGTAIRRKRCVVSY